MNTGAKRRTEMTVDKPCVRVTIRGGSPTVETLTSDPRLKGVQWQVMVDGPNRRKLVCLSPVPVEIHDYDIAGVPDKQLWVDADGEKFRLDVVCSGSR